MLSLADNLIFVVLCVFLLVLVLGLGHPVANFGRLLQWFWEELQRAVRDRMRDNAVPQDEEAMPEPFAGGEDPLPQPQDEEVALPALFAPDEVPQRQGDNRDPFIPTGPSASDSTILLASTDEDDSTDTSETSMVFRRTQSEPLMDTGRSSSGVPNRPIVPKITRSPRRQTKNTTSGLQSEPNAPGSAVGPPSAKARKPKLGTCNREPTIPEASEPSSGSKEQRDATATRALRGKPTSSNRVQPEPPAPGPNSQEHRDQPTTETRQAPRGRSQRLSEMSQLLAGIEEHLRENAFDSSPSSDILSSTSDLSEPNEMPLARPSRVARYETRQYSQDRSAPRFHRLTRRNERPVGIHTPPVTPTTSQRVIPVLTQHVAMVDSASGNSTETTLRRSSRLAAKTVIAPPPMIRRKPITADTGDTILGEERRLTHRVITAPPVLTPVFEQEEVETPGRVLRSMASASSRPPNQPNTEGPSDGSTTQARAGDKTKKDGRQPTRRVTSAPQVFQRQQRGGGKGLQTKAAMSSRDTNQRERVNTAGYSRQATPPDAEDDVVEEDRVTSRRVTSAPQVSTPRRQQPSGRVLRSMASPTVAPEREPRSKKGQKRRPRS